MSNGNSTILVFGAESVAEGGPKGTLGPGRVPIDAIKANLKIAMEQVSDLVRSSREAVGDLRLAHVDVALGIGIDGSVGLLGTGVSTKVTGTLTVRLQV